MPPPFRHPLEDPAHPGRRRGAPDPEAVRALEAELSTSDTSGPEEQVVLVDEAGRPIGVADKATVHGATTPRHLAFSCYGFDGWDRLLMTQRAAAKLTFPLVWTNTCCGHPAPGEGLAQAAARRLRYELGLRVEELRVVLPDFSYRASDGRVEENEFCPVLVCRVTAEPSPRSDEVQATEWWSWPRFLDAAADPDSGLSPWARRQAPLLDAALFRPAP